VIDTDVCSCLYTRRNDPLGRTATWRELIQGLTVVIATRSQAELRAGFARANWGEPRLANAVQRLEGTPTIPVAASVVDAFVQLTVEARRDGHGLHQKLHTGDRWVGATAIALDAPLLSGDAVFQGAPGIRLLDDEA